MKLAPQLALIICFKNALNQIRGDIFWQRLFGSDWVDFPLVILSISESTWPGVTTFIKSQPVLCLQLS